ncbi:MAG: hypothetical protein GX640_14565 [Fibrobacter sp.]|nr:hypothetical protein [Fibrobacter sp.]
MRSNIFSTVSESYQISHILFAGYVCEIPPDKRKGDSTHSFKLITTLGTSYCYFNNIETAKKVRGVLEGMLEKAKPAIFKNGGDSLDIGAVVSFSKVVKLKNSESGMTHAFLVSLNTVNEKSSQVWFTYKSEDTARHARNALWAKMESSGKIQEPHFEEQVTGVAECYSEIEN